MLPPASRPFGGCSNGGPNAARIACSSTIPLSSSLNLMSFSLLTLMMMTSNRLEVIIISVSKLKDMRFKEELSGMVEEQAIRAALGPPLEHPPKGRLAGGSMVYCEGNVRTDFAFRY